MRALFDTNLLIDYLNAVPQARQELQRYREKAVSIITWMEVMMGAAPEMEERTRLFLRTFNVVPLDWKISERAVELRREHHIRLPDAVIWASAYVHSMLLVTRNTKDFPSETPGIRIPYRLI